MKYIRILILLIAFSAPAAFGADVGYKVAFSPNGGGTELIVQTISAAQVSIRVAAYSFTSEPIAKALVEAHKKGVDVKVVLDKSQRTAKYTSATFLANMGVPTRINDKYAIMHNKYMVIDGKDVQQGSFNYSKAAEKKNAENVLVIKDTQELAKKYLDNWNKLWDEAEEYKPKY
jgi:phosphatidylserine/phosphatidylglycerophosphate/cardiolipin synthase-like enzyme